MAAKSQRLVFEITADADQAKKALDQLDRQSKLLEKGVEVPLTLEGASKASADLQDAATQARALATVLQHTPGMGNVAEEAARSAKELEGTAREAKKVEAALRDIEGVPPPDPRAGGATEQMQTLERSASGTKNAFSNLVGNTAQDLSGLSGSFGSLGVAIGQVAEYTSDAANEGGGLRAALSGAASFAGPMLALAAASFAVQKVLGDAAKRSQEAKEANEALLKSWTDTTGTLKDWQGQLEDAFSAGTASKVEDFNLVISKTLDATGDLEKTAVALGTMGVSIDDLGKSMSDADQDFTTWSEGVLRAADFGDDFAEKLTWIVDNNEKLGDVLLGTKTAAEAMLPPERQAEALDYAKALAQVKDDVEKIDTEKKAKDFLDLQASMSGMSDVVRDARDANASEQDAALQVTQVIHAQTRAREENAKAAEEGARKAEESGSILDQVNRELTESEDALSEATKKVSDEQDKWLGTTITLPAAQDDLTESVLGLTEQLTKQAKAGDEGAGSFEGQTKAALDNRDAQREVYQQAFDVVDIMGKQGATTDQLAAATKDMADRAYDLAIQNGASEEAAGKLRDTILTVPTSRSTEMTYAEQNYGTMLDHRDALAEDIETNVYFNGVVDKGIQQFLRDINFGAAGGSVSASSAVQPAGRSGAAAVGLRGVEGPVAAPMTLGTPRAARTASVAVSQPIVVNVNAGIVADTFQLQRAVVRGARSFQRLAGKRAAA